MSHDRTRANERLAEIFRQRISELNERGVSTKTLATDVGERTLNLIIAGHANLLPHGKVRSATIAIGLPNDLLNEAMVQIPIALQPKGGVQFPRRRMVPYRTRFGVRR